VNKKSLEEIGLIDEDPAITNCDDYDLWIRLALNGASFLGMPEKLARYRLHRNQASRNISRSLKSELVILEKYRTKTNLEKREERERYCRLCRDLVGSLVKEGNLAEARKYSYHLLTRGGFRFSSLFQTLTLIFYPSKYHLMSYLIPRIKERASLRLSKTINSFRQLMSQ
jgi:hypothetical protein